MIVLVISGTHRIDMTTGSLLIRSSQILSTGVASQTFFVVVVIVIY